MNWNKAYIVILDKGSVLDSFNYKTFHDRLTRAKGVINWWHYIDNTYIIIVEFGITATNITEYIQRIAPDKRFFVCELNLNDHNGWLPQKAWDWINKNKDET